jgi:hypothetical protein
MGREMLLHPTVHAWSLPGDGTRGVPGREPVATGGAGRELVRETPEVVDWDVQAVRVAISRRKSTSA